MEMQNFPKTNWRLLYTPPERGAMNMAVDEAILEAVGRGEVPTTLRLYRWAPPCLSIGYAQAVSDVDLPRLTSLSWDLVRRPTGGRAILHTDELTYAVIGSHAEPRLAGSVLQSYQVLSLALMQSMHLLGIQAQVKDKSIHPASQNPICFEVPSNYELTVNGKKMIGSAQARRKEGVLQHGSLPLVGDLARITQVLSFPSNEARKHAAQRLLTYATTVEAVLGYAITWEYAAQAFTNAFEQSLSLNLLPDQLSPQEQKRAIELSGNKYDNPHWTTRG